MAGLKFYLCQTDEGPQYVHLQADAKKLDPKFETVEIDTSKQALMDRLNHLLRSPVQGISLAEGADVEGEGLEEAPPPPPKPAYQPSMPPRSARTEAQIAWEEFIWDIPDEEAYRLDTLQQVIDTRRTEINGENR